VQGLLQEMFLYFKFISPHTTLLFYFQVPHSSNINTNRAIHSSSLPDFLDDDICSKRISSM
jgi:hypothetical protein